MNFNSLVFALFIGFAGVMMMLAGIANRLDRIADALEIRSEQNAEELHN